MKICVNFSMMNLALDAGKIRGRPFNEEKGVRKGANMNYTHPTEGDHAQDHSQDNGQLLAYLAGEADAAVKAHIEQCAACQQQVNALARLDGGLARGLHRLQCPPSLLLGEYHLGLLSAQQKKVVETHLHTCPHCLGELQQLSDFLTLVAPTLETSLAATVMDQVRVLVAQLVERLTPDALGAPAPLFTGVRGAQSSLSQDVGTGQYIYQADDLQIIVEIQDKGHETPQKMVIGLVLGLLDFATAVVILTQTGQQVASVTIDEGGNFEFANVAPGTYELVLSSDTLEVSIRDLQV